MRALSENGRPATWRRAKVLEWGCFAAIFLALVTNGANSALPLAACLFLVGGLCIAALLLLGRPERAGAPFVAGLCLFLLFTAWIGIQQLPVPEGLASRAWARLPEFGIAAWARISIAPAEGQAGWLSLALPFLTFLTGLLVFRADARACAAFRRVATAAGMLALMCLVQFLVTPDRLLFTERPTPGDSYTFVFVNRNTAATCLGLIMLMLLVNVREEWRTFDRTRLLAWIMNGVPLPASVRLWPLALQAGLLLVVVTCLALTKSRAGIGASAVAAAVSLGLMFWFGGGGGAPGFSRRRRGFWRKMAQSGARIAVVLLVAGLLAPRTILRSEIQGAEDARFCILEGLVAAARDNGLTGGGFGAFPFIFNPYRDPACGIRSVWDKAHNSYLEGFITLGLLFVPLVLVGFYGLVRAYGAGLRERRSMIAYPAAGLGGFCLVALHSALDFSLQIPGMAAFYALFAALTTRIALGRRGKGDGTRGEAQTPVRTNGKGGIAAAALCGLALLSILVAASRAKDAVSIGEARSFARALDAGEPVDTAALRALVTGRLPANRLETCNGEVLRASLTVLLADLDRIDRDQAYDAWAERLGQAERQVLHSLTCLPGDGNLWLRLAMLRQAGGEVPQEQASLMALSQQLDPSQERQLVGRLAHWNRLSSATLALSREEAAADVRNGLNYLSVADIRAVLRAPSSAMASIVRETAPLVSAARRDLLKKNGFEWLAIKATAGR